MEQEYLSPTRFCDRDHPEIVKQCLSLTADYSDETDRAVSIYRFVRDAIPYRFDYPATAASQTLERRGGNCFNKATLQIALCRRAGIQAAYSVILIRRDVFRPLLPTDIFELVSEPTVHVFCSCLLSDRWVAADATIDEKLLRAVYRKEGWPKSPWNGQDDARIPGDVLIEDQGIYANIDVFLLHPPKFWNDELLGRANEFLARVITASEKTEDGRG